MGSIIGSNSNDGIYLHDGSSNNTLAGNTCELNDDHGIPIAGSYNNVVTGNVVLNNSQSSAGSSDGICLYLADYNVITGNRCTYTQGVKTQRYGVNLSNAACDKNLATNVLIGNLTGSLNDSSTNTT